MPDRKIDMQPANDLVLTTLLDIKGDIGGIQADVAKIFEKLKKETIVDNYLTQTSNRPERNASASGPIGGPVQPASGTQSKQNSAPTRSPNAAAPAKTSRFDQNLTSLAEI